MIAYGLILFATLFIAAIIAHYFYQRPERQYERRLRREARIYARNQSLKQKPPHR
ncbi:hypothetical protein [Sphingomonas sp. G-3-2-10]|uniref:hypothetical protein n=1 Tax=Sphingomonas sp. G-3-2-10 TaxID=2728838 RepID=UPI00146E0CD0|nr:hypothetical protein [Sphingomonas sp. G-3-2-10]NML04159.1 hypothetical protein [Sphingomonas sp. G-3-2-10]